jgi:hypothetical protein
MYEVERDENKEAGEHEEEDDDNDDSYLSVYT